MKSYKYLILIMAISIFLWFYFFLPPLNFASSKAWLSYFCLVLEFFIIRLVLFSINTIEIKKKYTFNQPSALPLSLKISGGVLILLLIYLIGSSFVYSPLLRAKKYAQRISVSKVDFNTIPSYSFNQTAIIDRKSAAKLGDKVMGGMRDLVSQFSVSKEYSQISYKEGTYRVTPLAYDGFIKYLRNRFEGIPGYILVNTTTGETELVRLKKKMHYVPSAYFGENLYRKLRFQYPTINFGDPTFEIDEEGNPYYICTTYAYKGVMSFKKVNGVVIFDPVNGNSKFYTLNDVPKWVDRIFPENLITKELNDYGTYQKGFFNSLLGQEGVIKTSEGYNYISKDGDIWLYTGMTSVVNDASNVGFALVNLRTHEAQFINTSGADEYSVMDSAEGEVLNYGYRATFPVLININNEPFYLLSLKDSAGLVKMYALVDAKDYQQVYTAKADKDAKSTINLLIKQIGKTVEIDNEKEISLVIEDIKQATIEGNTYIYILSKNKIYSLPLTAENAPQALFLKRGQTIKIAYQEKEKINEIISLK